MTAAIIVQTETIASFALSQICNKFNIEVTKICDSSLKVVSLIRETSPNLLIIDTNKAETIQLLKSTPNQVKKIILSNDKEENYILNLIKNNATSICLKEQKATEIAIAIDWTKQGKTYLAPEVAEILIQAYRKEAKRKEIEAKIKTTLSQKEIQVLALLVNGYCNKEIAEFLKIKATTVNSHIEKIFIKLNCKNRTHAVATALKLKIIS